MTPASHAQKDTVAQWSLMKGTLAPGETAVLTIQSGSMIPMLPVGARITIEPTSGDLCAVGDIVVFRQQSRLVAHRLLFGWGHEPGGWFLQRGDGVSPLGFVRARAILGKVIAVEPSQGKFLDLTTLEARIGGLHAARRSLSSYCRTMIKSMIRKG